MTSFKDFFLQEKLVPEDHTFIEYLLGFLEKELDLIEMRRREGVAKNTGVNNVEVRIKPKDLKAEELPDVDDVYNTIVKNAKKLGIEKAKINRPSPNSSKFFSVHFKKGGKTYDIVLAQGANKGEAFESDLYNNVIKYLDESSLNVDEANEVEELFNALKNADPKFKIQDIVEFKRRSGSTKRKTVDLESTGEIIGDYVIEMKSPKRTLYLSLKNPKGLTFANLGIAGLFDKSFNFDTSMPEYSMLTDVGVDFDIIKKGLKAYEAGKTFLKRESSGGIVRKNSKLYKFLKTAWGKNYFYVKKYKNGFKAFFVDEDFIDQVLLRGLRIEKISYPYADGANKAKGFSMTLENDLVKYRLEIRNPSGGIVPNQINISLVKVDI